MATWFHTNAQNLWVQLLIGSYWHLHYVNSSPHLHWESQRKCLQHYLRKILWIWFTQITANKNSSFLYFKNYPIFSLWLKNKLLNHTAEHKQSLGKVKKMNHTLQEILEKVSLPKPFSLCNLSAYSASQIKNSCLWQTSAIVWSTTLKKKNFLLDRILN